MVQEKTEVELERRRLQNEVAEDERVTAAREAIELQQAARRAETNASTIDPVGDQ